MNVLLEFESWVLVLGLKFSRTNAFFCFHGVIFLGEEEYALLGFRLTSLCFKFSSFEDFNYSVSCLIVCSFWVCLEEVKFNRIRNVSGFVKFVSRDLGKMEDSSSIDSILEFLRRNSFMRAEAALISELSNNPSLNGCLQKLNFENNCVSKLLDKKKQAGSSRALDIRNDNHVSDELVVKEIQCGAANNLHESNHMNDVSVQTQSGSGANAADFWEERFTFSEGLVDTELDLPPWNHASADVIADSEVYSIDPSIRGFVNPRRSSHEKLPETGKSNKVVVEDIFSPFEKIRTGSSSQVSQYDLGKACQSLEVDKKVGNSAIQEEFITTSWPRSEESIGASSDHWKDCSVTTVYPLSKGSTSTKDIGVPNLDKRQGKKKVGASDSKIVIKEQENDVGTSLYLGKSQYGNEHENLSSLAFSLARDGPREDLPRLPHVKIKSEDKSMNFTWEEKHERDILDEKLINTENGFVIGSYLDIPIGQEINSSG